MVDSNDVSQNLDIIAQVPGDMLARGAGGWERLAVANPGWQLFAQGTPAAPVFVAGQHQVHLEKTIVQNQLAGVMTPIIWDAATFDDANFWDPANPTRINVPANVSRMNFTGGWFSATVHGGPVSLSVRGSGGVGVAMVQRTGGGDVKQVVSTGPMDVIPLDWCELGVFGTGFHAIAASPLTFFTAEISRVL